MFFNLNSQLIFRYFVTHNYIFSVENIPLDSSFLNIFSSSFLHLVQIIGKTNVFLRYDVLDFSNFLYSPQITQYNFLIFLVTEINLVLFYHFYHNHQGKMNLYNLANFYLLT